MWILQAITTNFKFYLENEISLVNLSLKETYS